MTRIADLKTLRPFVEVEFHVSVVPEDQGDGKARIVHVVVRMDTLRWKESDPSWDYAIACMESPLIEFLFLRHVILETPLETEGDGLEEKLGTLRARGRVHWRTCGEAQEMAYENRDPLDTQFIIGSPLWYSTDSERVSERRHWCVYNVRSPFASHRTDARSCVQVAGIDQ